MSKITGGEKRKKKRTSPRERERERLGEKGEVFWRALPLVS